MYTFTNSNQEKVKKDNIENPDIKKDQYVQTKISFPIKNSIKC